MEAVLRKYPYLVDRKLNEFLFFGSHDSGAYSMTKRNLQTDVWVNFAQAQSFSISAQLISGCRYLDVRIAFLRGEFYVVHGPVLGPPMREVFAQLRAFLHASAHSYSRDVVLVVFAPEHKSMTADRVAEFGRLLQTQLGSFLYAPSRLSAAAVATGSAETKTKTEGKPAASVDSFGVAHSGKARRRASLPSDEAAHVHPKRTRRRRANSVLVDLPSFDSKMKHKCKHQHQHQQASMHAAVEREHDYKHAQDGKHSTTTATTTTTAASASDWPTIAELTRSGPRMVAFFDAVGADAHSGPFLSRRFIRGPWIDTSDRGKKVAGLLQLDQCWQPALYHLQWTLTPQPADIAVSLVPFSSFFGKPQTLRALATHMNPCLLQFLSSLKHSNKLHKVNVLSVDFVDTVDVMALYQLAYA